MIPASLLTDNYETFNSLGLPIPRRHETIDEYQERIDGHRYKDAVFTLLLHALGGPLATPNLAITRLQNVIARITPIMNALAEVNLRSAVQREQAHENPNEPS